MSPVTPDHPSRAGGVRADDRPGGRAAPARRVPAPRASGSPRGRAPLPVAAGVAAGWAAVTSYLPVAIVLGLVQLGADSTTLTGTLRTALAGWLVGHGVPLHTESGPFGLAPLALTVLALWRLTRAGVHVSRAIGAAASARRVGRCSPRVRSAWRTRCSVPSPRCSSAPAGPRSPRCGQRPRSRWSAPSPPWSARSGSPP
ncbi:hypothetical protein GCM10027614_59410 [Micromonospora vulcania]